MLYLDNAATTKVHGEVLEEMLKYFNYYYGNSEAKYYEQSEMAKKGISNARKNVASIVGCAEDEVIFTSGATESNNFILKSIVNDFCEKGNHIITTSVEHPSIYETCKFLETKGVKITYLSVDNHGLINLDELRKSITNHTILVSIIWVNNEIGTIQKMKEIDSICAEKGIFLHSDATQAVGKTPINLKEFEALKFLTFSSHKIFGPKGIGALIIKKDKNGIPFRLTPLIHGGEQEFGYRAGTLSNALIVGFGKACEIAQRNFEENIGKLKDFEVQIKNKLKEKFPAMIQFNNDFDEKIPGLINVRFKGVNNQILLKKLSQFIAASNGSACSVTKPSRVLKEIGLDNQKINESIRLSLSPYLKKEDLNILDQL